MSARDYQNLCAEKLSNIFSEEQVKIEWDSVTNDGHTMNHKKIYAPRIDIAVSPFNPFANLALGQDNTAVMKKHLFVKKIEERMGVKWSCSARCFIAIEVVHSGNLKHIMGDVINACVSGAIGIVVGNDKTIPKIDRICKYIQRLEGLERLNINSLKNFVRFKDNDFLEFLESLQSVNKKA